MSSDIKDVESCDIILICTSSKSVVLDDINFKTNAIVYDITQPSNVKLQNKNIRVISGGIAELPDDWKLSINLGYGKKMIYGCLGETLLLSINDYHRNFSLGNVTIEKVDYIGHLFKKSNFKVPKIIL